MNNYNPYGYTPQANSGMNWVQGEAGANASYVPPGGVGVFFDSGKQVFYIKSVDQMGKPQPLEVYDYARHVDPAPPDMSQYVTKGELQKMLEELKGGIKNE